MLPAKATRTSQSGDAILMKATKEGFMESYQFSDALTGSTVACFYPELMAGVDPAPVRTGLAQTPALFFPGCSFINYALPLVQSVYDLLKGAGRVDGISLVCCGKILSYEHNGKEVRAAHEEQLREHVVAAGVKRIVTACPNCVKAMREAFAADERTSHIEIVPLSRELVDLGYRIDPEVARAMVAAECPASAAAQGGAAYFTPHDSCPDRDTGEFADALREILPEGSVREAAHNRRRSFCCGSILRAAGKPERGDEQARRHGEEALEAQGDVLVTSCVSCAFQLSHAQKSVPVFHYLELLYDWRVQWTAADQFMRLRFLFDDPIPPEEKSHRTFVELTGASERDGEGEEA